MTVEKTFKLALTDTDHVTIVDLGGDVTIRINKGVELVLSTSEVQELRDIFAEINPLCRPHQAPQVHPGLAGAPPSPPTAKREEFDFPLRPQ